MTVVRWNPKSTVVYSFLPPMERSIWLPRTESFHFNLTGMSTMWLLVELLRYRIPFSITSWCVTLFTIWQFPGVERPHFRTQWCGPLFCNCRLRERLLFPLYFTCHFLLSKFMVDTDTLVIIFTLHIINNYRRYKTIFV